MVEAVLDGLQAEMRSAGIDLGASLNAPEIDIDSEEAEVGSIDLAQAANA